MNRIGAIGIDLGATYLRAIRLSGGQLRWIGRWRTPAEPEHLDTILIDLSRAVKGSPPTIMGIATAPVLDENGCVYSWPNQPAYEGFSLRQRITAVFGPNFLTLDDCAAAAVGEHVITSFSNTSGKTTLYVGVGTGIGGGVVECDRLVKAVPSVLGLGHIRVLSAGQVACRCGGIGCVQAVASGSALKERATAEGVTPDLVASLASRGHYAATRLLQSCIDPLTELILIAKSLIDPDCIVIGGGLTTGGQLIQWLNQRMSVLRMPSIRPVRFGDAAPAVGAAIWALVKADTENLFRPFSLDFVGTKVPEVIDAR